MAIAVALAVVGLTGALAACGSDSKSNATPSGPSTSAGATPTTGEPIRIGLITRPGYMGYLPAGAEAAISRINADGGVNGRPLKLVTCNNEDNSNVAAACAQKFAADPTILATVGDNNQFGGDSNPPLADAKVAGVGTSTLGAGDFASPRVFTNNSGGLEFLAAAAFLHDSLGAKSIGMGVADTPTARGLPALVNKNVLASRGTELAKTVAVPLTAADVSPQAASLADTDGQMLAFTQDLVLRFIQSSRQQGFAGPFVVSETVVNAEGIPKALSEADAKDLYALTYFDKTSKGYGRFLKDMGKYQHDVVPGDLNGIAWLSVQTFADVASKLTTVTREGVWDAMNQLSNYDTGGMTPQPLDYTTPGTALGGTAPRLVPSVLSVFADVYKGGEYVARAKKQTPIPVFS